MRSSARSSSTPSAWDLQNLLLAGAASLCAIGFPAVAAATPTTTGAKYVALGDSYSSGEGSPPYHDGTDNPSNLCHRSSQAYGSLLAKAKGYSPDAMPATGTFDLAACSGAVTHDLFLTNFKYSDEPAQLDHVGPATKVVTLTIGGNDLGFSNWAGACLDFAPTLAGMIPGPNLGNPGSWGCTSNALLTKQTNAALDALAGVANGAILRTATPMSADPSLGEPRVDQAGNTVPIHSLRSVLLRIHALAPSAKIVLGGYPNVFGTDKTRWTKNAYNKVSGYQCGVTPPTALTYDYLDATTGVGTTKMGANAIAARYTAIQVSTVKSLAASGVPVSFVNPQAKFAGHANCDTLSVTTSGSPVSGQKWINGISPTISGTFHPNADGHRLGYLPTFTPAIPTA